MREEAEVEFEQFESEVKRDYKEELYQMQQKLISDKEENLKEYRKQCKSEGSKEMIEKHG